MKNKSVKERERCACQSKKMEMGFYIPYQLLQIDKIDKEQRYPKCIILKA